MLPATPLIQVITTVSDATDARRKFEVVGVDKFIAFNRDNQLNDEQDEEE